MHIIITLYSLCLTVIAYLVSLFAAKRYPSPLTATVFISTILLILGLKASHLTYDDYADAKQWITSVLGPATAALAVPLYKNRNIIKRNLIPIFAGILTGTVVTISTVLSLGVYLQFSPLLLKSFSVKSITIPVAAAVAKIIGGDPVLVGAFVMITGMLGAMFGPVFLRLLKISDPLARGLAIGTISHGIGTASVLKEGELPGAASGIAMGMSAVITSLIIPWVIHWLL